MTNWIIIPKSSSFDQLVLPKSDEPDGKYDIYGISVEVMFTDGNDIYIGHATVDKDEEWYDNGFQLTWQTGRSGWQIDGVTHWAYLPELPS